MIEYRCPEDSRLLFKAEGVIDVRIEAHCPKCKKNGREPLVVPVPYMVSVILRTCECRLCGRRQTITTPVGEPGYCVPCGARSMKVVEEISSALTEQEGRIPEPVRVR